MKRVILIGGGLIGSSIYNFLTNHSNTEFDVILFEKKRLPKIEKKQHIICDISNKNSFKDKLNFVHKVHGKIDAVVNCSFPKIAKKNTNPLNLDFKIFNTNYLVHLNSYLNVIVESINYFKKNKTTGSIVSFASIYGSSTPNFSIYDNKILTSLEYNFIKNNIIHANKYYSKFIRGSGIRLNCISPGGIFDNHGKKFVNNYSKNTNNNSMLDKEDLNTIVEYLISDGSKKITGQNIVVDDGFTL